MVENYYFYTDKTAQSIVKVCSDKPEFKNYYCLSEIRTSETLLSAS